MYLNGKIYGLLYHYQSLWTRSIFCILYTDGKISNDITIVFVLQILSKIHHIIQRLSWLWFWEKGLQSLLNLLLAFHHSFTRFEIVFMVWYGNMIFIFWKPILCLFKIKQTSKMTNNLDVFKNPCLSKMSSRYIGLILIEHSTYEEANCFYTMLIIEKNNNSKIR